MQKLVVVGMANPQSNLPLWTKPENCTGHRLWRLAAAQTGITERQWLAMTDRRNLCEHEWDRSHARAVALRMMPSLADRTVLLLGSEVMMAFREPGDRLWRPLEWSYLHDWAMVPHPSGVNRFYNNPVRRTAVETFLGELVAMHRGVIDDRDEVDDDQAGGPLDSVAAG